MLKRGKNTIEFIILLSDGGEIWVKYVCKYIQNH